MRKTIWESLLDAEMNLRYWKEKTAIFCSRDRLLKIALAILSSSAVAGWGLWQDYPLIWKALSSLTAFIAIAMPFINYQKSIEIACDLCGKWSEIMNDYEHLWIEVNNAPESENLIEKYVSVKKKESSLVNRKHSFLKTRAF